MSKKTLKHGLAEMKAVSRVPPTRDELVERLMKVAEIIYECGGIDGNHHKQWVLDRVLRAALDEQGYLHWVAMYEDDGEHIWDVGVAP